MLSFLRCIKVQVYSESFTFLLSFFLFIPVSIGIGIAIESLLKNIAFVLVDYIHCPNLFLLHSLFFLLKFISLPVFC